MNTIISSIEKIMPSLTFAQELALFYENESSKIKIVANIAVGLACAGAIIHIFSGDASKYFLMIPIGIVLLQISIAYYRMRSFIEEDSIRHRGFIIGNFSGKFKKVDEEILCLKNEVTSLKNEVMNLNLSPDIQPYDSVSQIPRSDLQDDAIHPVIFDSQNSTLTTA